MIYEVVLADIAKQLDIEAVVNSANANLLFGSGVTGAIHSTAGPELEDYCEPYAHYLNDEEPETVSSKCMQSVVEAVNKTGITSIAIPAIGRGVFKFPKELPASIMATSLRQCFEQPTSLQKVRFCVADANTKAVSDKAFLMQ
jgi:O-acetyl-ADP-ribose deacetylase (regulator of RNase III)